MRIDINCDMGEGMPDDALLMPYISSANIACGYHAGDENIMQHTVDLAIQNNASIGAHPGFNDRANFGRAEIRLSVQEIYELVAEQVAILREIVQAKGAMLRHVKPHGALYNMSAKDPVIARSVAQAVYDMDKKLVLFGLSDSCSITEAKNIGLTTASEVFADRTYQDDGSLTPRSKPNAMIATAGDSLQQVLQMIRQQSVTSVSGKTVPIIAETICIHGDGEHALAFARYIHQTLQQHGIGIGKA